MQKVLKIKIKSLCVGGVGVAGRKVGVDDAAGGGAAGKEEGAHSKGVGAWVCIGGVEKGITGAECKRSGNQEEGAFCDS